MLETESRMMNKVRNSFLFFIFVFSISVALEASQVDFSWSTPENFVYKEDSGDEKIYIVWFYSIKNTTDKKILVPIETFLNTDTQKSYEDKYLPDIVSKVSKGNEEYMTASDMKGEFGPGVTKMGVAVFEDIDPYAQKINVFATGLSHFFFWRWRLVDYSYKITYKKSGNKWILVEHGFNKDSSHRNYADKFK